MCGWRHLGLAALLLLMAAGTARAGAEREVSVLWFQRASLYEIVDGRPEGLLAVADELLRGADLRPTYVELPHRRVLQTLRDAGRPGLIGVGWFRTPEREVWLRYSLPILRDPAMQVMIRRDDLDLFLRHQFFASLACDRALRPGLVGGYSYGGEVDAMLVKCAPDTASASQEILLCGMLKAGRCDYLLGNRPHLEAMLASLDMSPEDFAFVGYSDLPQGGLRHLVFSRETSQETVDRVNAVILRRLGDLR